MAKKLTMSLGIILVLVVFFLVIGPRILTHIISNTPMPKPLQTGPIRIKANGTLSLVENSVVLTTPHGTNNYVLVGGKINELKKHAEKKETLFVFGGLMTPMPKKVGDLAIRYRIDVSEFDTKDFEIGQKLSEQVYDSIKIKVAEKTAFREATLQKLGLRNPRLDVISGKLIVLPAVLYIPNPKEHVGLMVVDKYGDSYFLYNNGAMLKPYSQYMAFLNMGMDVVVVGEICLPDPTIKLPTANNFIPFSANKMYNLDLSEFVVKQEKSEK